MNQTPNNPRMNFVNRLLAGNPQVAKQPDGTQRAVGNSKWRRRDGEQIARNLCESYGITPEEAYAQAMRFFRGR